MDTARSVSELSSTTLNSPMIYPPSQDESLEMAMEIDTDEDREEEHLVCFGMIPDLIAQFLRTRGHGTARHLRAAMDGEEEHIALNMNLEDNFCGLSTLSGHLIAVLNTKTSCALAKVQDIGPVRYLCFVQRSQLQAGLEELQRSPDKVRFSVDITTVGPETLGDEVARELRDGRLYLQQPYIIPESLEYRNPQSLDVQYHSGDLVSTEEGSAADLNLTTLGRGVEQIKTPMDILLATIDSLPKNAGLAQINVDARVVTTLLTHQREALDFIIGRESGNKTKYTSLWSKSSSRKDQEVYQHLITGSKSPRPDDIPGGILADEMGLCKTLSMISAIVTTLEQARIHQASAKPPGSNTTITSSTLVVVPSFLLLEGWVDEIYKHIKPGALTYYKYHGPERKLDLAKQIPDVVLTTYGTVASECGRLNRRSVLTQVHWYRIVLDEAHIIRNWSTKQFRAISNLSGHIRWCMTGTPVQNGVDDIGSLVRFLRLPVLGDAANFRKYISGRIRLSGGLSASDYINLRLLLSSICLRRNTTVLELPGVEYACHRPRFSLKEREAYNDLIRRCTRAIDKSILGKADTGITRHKKIGLTASSNAVLGSLLRLRLFCDQGVFLKPEHGIIPPAPDEVLSFLNQKGVSACEVCRADVAAQDASQPDYGFHLTNCHLLVCHDCVPKFRADLSHVQADGKTAVCPFCGEVDDGVNLLLRQDTSGPSEPGPQAPCPSKLEALITDLSNTAGQEKSIVFSFWLKSLDLVENLLRERNITFRRVDGSRSKSDKRQSLLDFQTQSDVSVLLMTFGTGSVGLNDLNVASRVHILEPQWNPSVESQAIGRVSRLGQTKKVTVVRYVMQKSIEELIENRQLLKLMLAVGGGLGDAGKGLNGQAQKNTADLRQYLNQLLAKSRGTVEG